MKAYFTNLNPREQKLVLAAAFFVVLFLPYQFIYAPFQDNLTKMETKVTESQKNIVWMKSKSLEVRKLKGSSNSSKKSKQSLLSLIETTTKKSKLNKNLRKVQPAGSSNVKVWLDEVAFDNLMQWLDILVVTHGLTIQDITIEKQSNKGIVNARINMSAE
ncbi:MAG: type II secretion system protein GspM [Thiohalomonadales bacterium]